MADIKTRIKKLAKEKKLNTPDRLKKCQDHAKCLDGMCLSTEYRSMLTHMTWKCKEGHVWEALPHNVINRDQWCPKCSAKKSNHSRLLNVNDLNNYAKEKGGKCLSSQSDYVNVNSKLKWKCKHGHVWEASASSIKYGNTWCPTCKINYKELLVKAIFEQLTGKKFSKVRPKWLVNNNTGKKLELDGFNEKLMLAFEYNGIQHYISEGFYHNDESLKLQNYRDNLKKELCEKNGVTLITIPYNVKNHKLINFIKEQLHKLKVSIINKNINIDAIKVYNLTRHEKFKEFIESLGYELLDNYKHVNEKVHIKCDKGHIWHVKPRAVQNGNRCPYCSKKVKYTLDYVKNKAEELGLTCIDDKYINNATYLNFICDHCGKRLRRIPYQLNHGKGCCQNRNI